MTVPSGAIEATTFAIPHLVFNDPVTPADAIATVNAYHLYDWGVYDNGEFFFRAPDPTRLTWQARLSDGAQLDLEGDTGAQVFNGVIVSYTDPLGRRASPGRPPRTGRAPPRSPTSPTPASSTRAPRTPRPRTATPAAGGSSTSASRPATPARPLSGRCGSLSILCRSAAAR
jgi:hypothetical protein